MEPGGERRCGVVLYLPVLALRWRQASESAERLVELGPHGDVGGAGFLQERGLLPADDGIEAEMIPDPQPASRMRWPFANPARFTSSSAPYSRAWASSLATSRSLSSMYDSAEYSKWASYRLHATRVALGAMENRDGLTSSI